MIVWQRTVVLLSVASLVIAVGCGGGEQTSDSNDSAPDSGETEADAGDDCTSDDESVYYRDEDGDGFGVESDFEVACETPDGYAERSGDCDDSDPDIHPEAAEICDDVDHDCDGEVNAGEVEPQDCQLQDGVCQGATVAECDGEAYRSCQAGDYSSDYTDSDDENWQCDGLDNDCDGTADEACCEGDAPEPTSVGATSEGGTHPVLVEAVDGAPEDAAYLASWSTDDFLAFQFFDELGDSVDNAKVTPTIPADYELTGFDIAPAQDEYELVWTVVRDDGSERRSRVYERTIAADLSSEGETGIIADFEFAEDEDGNSPDPQEIPIYISNPSVIEADGRHYVGWLNEWFGFPPRYGVSVAQYDSSAPQSGAPVINLSQVVDDQNNEELEFALSAHQGHDEFAVGWLHGDEDTMYGAIVEQGSDETEQVFEVPVDEEIDGEHLDLFWTDTDEIAVLFPDIDDEGDTSLHMATVDSNSGDELDSTPLTSGSDVELNPHTVEVDGGDRLLFWERGDEPRLVGASFDPDDPGTLDDPAPVAVDENGPTNPQLARGGEHAFGAFWTFTDSGAYHFAPLSQQGVPICEPAP